MFYSNYIQQIEIIHLENTCALCMFQYVMSNSQQRNKTSLKRGVIKLLPRAVLCVTQ